MPADDLRPVSAQYAVGDPGQLRGRLHSPALLVVAESGSAAEARTLLERRPQVRRVEQLGLASLVLLGRSMTVASVTPESYRRWSESGTAGMQGVWAAVARGELAVTHGMAEGLQLSLGATVSTGAGDDGAVVRVGAVATTVPRVDLVVNGPRGAQLGIVPDNALLVELDDDGDAGPVRTGLLDALGDRFSVADLTRTGKAGGEYAARLAGSSVASVAGSFRYRWFPDGTVQPDPAWVAGHIRTEEVPLLGRVTCHRILLPQLRGALQEVIDTGIAASIHTADYGGCYVPRFIGSDPSRGLSLHTWGLAVDLNVASNQLGTTGAIDRRVVEIFRRWVSRCRKDCRASRGED